MDKLEKALEKARQERGAAGPKPEKQRPAQTAAGSFPSASLRSLREDVLDAHRILAHRTRSPEADLFRLLRTQILQAMEKTGAKTLAVTSPNYGDGKTTIAINLAVSVALDLKQTALLVDLDLRKPCVHAYLGLEAEAGLTDYLAGQADLASCFQRLPFERLSVLPAGRITDHSSETIGSPQMAALADELKARYPDRLIIYDMPPILEQDDPLAFLPHVDALLLIVRNGVTRTDEIKRSLDILANANVIGTVLNNA